MVGTGRLVLLLALVASLAPARHGAAQEVRLQELTPEMEARVLEILNEPGTLLFRGGGRVPPGVVVPGDVGVVRGPLQLDGRIDGGVVVVEGALRLGPGARVEGDAIVVGGSVEGPASAVAGSLVVVEEALALEVRGDRVVRRRPEREGEGAGLLWGRARLMVRSSGTFNRVEGLPVLAGPVLETDGPDPFRLDVMGLWRSESGLSLDADEMGYWFRVEKRFDARPEITLEATYHSLMDPLSELGVSELESSLATFLLHKDYRDYLERKGWSASVGLDLAPTPLAVRLEYRDDDHRFAPVSSPWTLRRNDDPWRPQPLVAEGELRTLGVEAVLDTRNDEEDPTYGWWARARLLRGVGGELSQPPVFEASTPAGLDGPVEPRPANAGFTRVSLDLRRYNRVSPEAELDLRLFWSGSVDGDPLPPQFQQALGGEGTLPGYGLFSLDCGARSRRLYIQRTAFDDDADAVQPVFPGYGCDRVLLLQTEYRRHLDLDLDLGGDPSSHWGQDSSWYPRVELDPTLVAFANLGRGWSREAGVPDPDTFLDAGAGLHLGDLGFFFAYPLRGGSERFNFFVRLQRRF